MSVAEAQQRISGWEFAEWQEWKRIRAERLGSVNDG